MELGAAITAFPPLIKLLQETAQSLFRYSKHLPTSQDHVEYLAMEADSFADLLLRLRDVIGMASSANAVRQDTAESRLYNKIEAQGKLVSNLLKEALMSVKHVCAYPQRFRLKTLVAKLKWRARQQDFTHILQYMMSTKGTIDNMINLSLLEQLIEQSQAWATAQQIIPPDVREKLKYYRKRVRNLELHSARLERDLLHAHHSKGPTHQQKIALLELTGLVKPELRRQYPALKMVLSRASIALDSDEFMVQLGNATSTHVHGRNSGPVSEEPESRYGARDFDSDPNSRYARSDPEGASTHSTSLASDPELSYYDDRVRSTQQAAHDSREASPTPGRAVDEYVQHRRPRQDRRLPRNNQNS